MRFNFQLPSCNYNIVVSKEEIEALSRGDVVHCDPWRNACPVSRNTFNGKDFDKETVECGNYPGFYLNHDVADMEEGDYPIQFLSIIPEKEE